MSSTLVCEPVSVSARPPTGHAAFISCSRIFLQRKTLLCSCRLRDGVDHDRTQICGGRSFILSGHVKRLSGVRDGKCVSVPVINLNDLAVPRYVLAVRPAALKLTSSMPRWRRDIHSCVETLESNIPASVDEALSSVTIIQPSPLRTRRVYLVRLVYIQPYTYILAYMHPVKPFLSHMVCISERQIRLCVRILRGIPSILLINVPFRCQFVLAGRYERRRRSFLYSMCV